MEVFDGLLHRTESTPDQVRHLYDEWAAGYDANLSDWEYEAPQRCAAYAASIAKPDAAVLDVGCGTGLSGAALKVAGFQTIDGIDLSPASIAKASVRGVYRSANVVDLSRLPSSMADASYGALVCVGVMSYLPDTEAICREFCRLTVPGAPIVLTQRDDLFTGRDTQGAFDLLSRDGLWQQIEVTGPLPYLPGNPEFEGVGVHYCVFKRL